MFPRDTIAAISTPAGSGGIHVVRVSGPAARELARRLFPRLPPEPESHHLYPGVIVDAAGQPVDRGLCVLMAAPRSYTGEDVVELHGHGGALVARTILSAALACGARAAERGEFTLRAFLNGKLDLAQAEAVADLIAARTPAAMRVAGAQLGGELSREVEALRERLVGVMARLEVAIDFAEEDVGDLDGDALAEEAGAVHAALVRLAATFSRGRLLREGARVAIVGKPNVGKSSLLNRLVRSDRAIVTPVPGTTRDVLEEGIDLDGMPVVFIDTAGLRDSCDEVERLGIERTRRALEAADLAVVVLDAGRGLDGDDAAIIDATRHHSRIVLINKVDLPNRIAREAVPDASGTAVVEASMKTGAGLQELCRAIAAMLSPAALEDGGVVVTRERHVHALQTASASLESAIDSLRAGNPPDIVAVDVMAALDHLGEIVGRTSPEAILDRIFAEFCIGK